MAISASTIDRALRDKKLKLKRRLYGRTKPGTLLRHKIPMKTDTWDVKRPGFLEADLVSHSGESSFGEFIFSLNLTDIYSSWVDTRSVMGKGEAGVLKALERVSEKLEHIWSLAHYRTKPPEEKKYVTLLFPSGINQIFSEIYTFPAIL